METPLSLLHPTIQNQPILPPIAASTRTIPKLRKKKLTKDDFIDMIKERLVDQQIEKLRKMKSSSLGRKMKENVENISMDKLFNLSIKNQNE